MTGINYMMFSKLIYNQYLFYRETDGKNSTWIVIIKMFSKTVLLKCVVTWYLKKQMIIQCYILIVLNTAHLGEGT